METITLLGTALGIIASLIGVMWLLLRLSLRPIEMRLENIEKRLKNHDTQLSALAAFGGRMIAVLYSRKVIDEVEYSDLRDLWIKSAGIPTEATEGLTLEEKERLNFYLRKAHQGQRFSPEEVEDYRRLVEKLERAKKGSPEVWPLVALGAFLFGLYLGSKRKEEGR